MATEPARRRRGRHVVSWQRTLARILTEDCPVPPPSSLAEKEEIRPLWPVFFGIGALLALAGFLALFVPRFMAEFALWYWGWFLIARGVVDVVGSFFARKQSSFLSHLVMGILALVVGALILTDEDKAAKVITLL